MRILGVSKATERTIKIDQTDLELKRGQLAQGWFNAKTSRISANKPSGGSGSAPTPSGITTPAILFGEHINRVKNFYSKNATAGNLIVGYEGLDEKTRGALEIEEGQRVEYRADGSFVIQVKGEKGVWSDTRQGTIEDLKQGFINTVKGGMGGDGTQTEGFQDESEKGFNQIFGTTSGSMIFKGWGKPVEVPTTTTTDKKETPEQRAIRIAKE